MTLCIFHIAFSVAGKPQNAGELGIHIPLIHTLIPAAAVVRRPACGIALPHRMVHIVIVVVDGGEDRLLCRLLHALGDDPDAAVLRNGAEQHQQDKDDGEDHGRALAGAFLKVREFVHL